MADALGADCCYLIIGMQSHANDLHDLLLEEAANLLRTATSSVPVCMLLAAL